MAWHDDDEDEIMITFNCIYLYNQIAVNWLNVEANLRDDIKLLILTDFWLVLSVN